MLLLIILSLNVSVGAGVWNFVYKRQNKNKKHVHYMTNKPKPHDALQVIVVECLSCTCPDGRSPIRTPIPVTGTPGFSTSMCFNRLWSRNHEKPQVFRPERRQSEKKIRPIQVNTQHIGKHNREHTPKAAPDSLSAVLCRYKLTKSHL